MKITNFLHTGAENAISAPELCRLAELNPRALRQYIVKERAAGEEILYRPGGHGGYFLPSADPEQAQRERIAFYNTQRARAMCTLKTLQSVARALGRPVGQINLLEDEIGDKPNG